MPGPKTHYGRRSKDREARELRQHLNIGATAGGTTDHGTLTGLGDDDHSQYVHLSTARTITGQHSFSPATPQAPFLLSANAQGQLVTGLRADQLSKQVIAGTGLTDGGTLTADVTLNHGTGDFGDLHTNYAEHDQAETISGAWTFAAQVAIEYATGPQLTIGYDSDSYISLKSIDAGAAYLFWTGSGAGAANPLWIQKGDDDLLVVFRANTGYDRFFMFAEANVYKWGFGADATTNDFSITKRNGAVTVSTPLTIDYSGGYLNVGTRLGIGVTPSYQVHIQGTGSPQFRMGYDASNYLDVRVSDVGRVYFSGSRKEYLFEGAVGLGNRANWAATAVTIDDTTYKQLRITNSAEGTGYFSIDVAGNTGGANFFTDGGGDIRFQPGGNVVLAPGGGSFYPLNTFDIDLGTTVKVFKTIYAAELQVGTLVAANIMSTIGGRVVISPTTVLTGGTWTAWNTTMPVLHNNLNPGDLVMLEAGNFEPIMVLSNATATADGYEYKVKRGLDGVSHQWYGGDAVLNAGHQGTGFIDQYAIDAIGLASNGGPTIVGNIQPTNPELVTNPGFETAGGGGADIWGTWSENAGDGTLANETTIKHSGSDAMKAISGASLNTYVGQSLTVVAQKWYFLSFWAYGDGTYAGDYAVYDEDNSAWLINRTSTGVTAAGWTQVFAAFQAGVGNTDCTLYLYGPSTSGGTCYFDDVSCYRNHYSEWSSAWAIGMLDGLYGLSNTIGVGLGRYEAGYNYLTITDTNGLQFYDDNQSLVGSLSSDVWTLGGASGGEKNLYITPSAIQLRESTTVLLEINATPQIIIGDDSGGEYVLVDSNGIELFGGDYKVVDISNVGLVTIGYAGGGEYTEIDGNGIRLYGGSNKVIELDSSGNATFGRVTDNYGNAYWNSSNQRLEFRGGTSGTDVQAYINTDGSIVAGNGAVTLNDYGVRIAMATTYQPYTSLEWMDGSASRATIDFLEDEVDFVHGRIVLSDSTSDKAGSFTVQVWGGSDGAFIEWRVNGGTSGAALSQMRLRSDGDTYLNIGTTGFDGVLINGASISTNPSHMLEVIGDGYFDTILFVKESTNANMTYGATLNQLTADNEILAFKSSDVEHLATGSTETDTYARFKKINAYGGLDILGIGGKSGQTIYNGLYLKSAATHVTSGKTSSDGAMIMMAGFKNTSGTLGSLGTNNNLLAILDYTTTIYIFDADGDIYVPSGQGTALNNLTSDAFDDMAVLNGLRAITLGAEHELYQRFGEFVDYAKPVLEATGVMVFNEKGYDYMSLPKMQMLMVDAVRQFHDRQMLVNENVYSRLARYEQAFLKLGLDPKLLEV